jgi:hypothetical protein
MTCRKGLPSENETKKRQRIQEMKEYECGRRCLSPSIFRKSKGPIIFATSTSAAATNIALTDGGAKPLQSGLAFKGKLAGSFVDATGLPKDLSTNDYDINQAMDQKDLHGNKLNLTTL